MLSVPLRCLASSHELDRRAQKLTSFSSIILPSGPMPATDDVPLQIRIIDWELSQLSSASADLGQMLAELFQLTHFRGLAAGVWLMQAFLRGYGPLEDEAAAFRTAVHVGTHLICWGSSVPGWGTAEQVAGVVEVGRELVVRAWGRERAFFEGGPLAGLFVSAEGDTV